MPRVEVTRQVPMPFDEAWSVVSNREGFPSFMRSVVSVTVLERGDGWTVEEWVARMRGAKFRWVERNEDRKEEGRIVYRQTEGDLRRFEGEWRLTPSDGGTTVTLTAEFEFGLPMLAGMLNPVAKILFRENVESMLDGLQGRTSAG